MRWCNLEACCMDSTAQKEMAPGEKGPATQLKLGTYTLLRSFSHASHQSQSRSFVPSHPYVCMYVLATGVSLSSGRLTHENTFYTWQRLTKYDTVSHYVHLAQLNQLRQGGGQAVLHLHTGCIQAHTMWVKLGMCS